MKRNLMNSVAALALGALTAFPVVIAHADDTSEEIRLLKARLRQLEEKVSKQDREQKETQARIRQAGVVAPPMVCKDGPCPPPPPMPPPVWVSFANGLKVESYDKDFSFKIGGRIFVDGGINSEPIEPFPPAFPPFPVALKPFFPAHGANGFGNQVGFRQARLEVEGKAWHDWLYKLQYDFLGASNGLVQGGIRDFWLAWRPDEHYVVQIGNQFEATSMERMASSKYRDFIERALPSDLLAGNRHVGIAAVTGGDAPGLLGNPSWSLKGGIYSTSFEDGNPQAASFTTTTVAGDKDITSINFGIPAGSSSLLNPLPGGHQYWDAALRLTYAPIRTQESLLHLGGWIRYQNPNDATVANDNRVLQPGSTLASEGNIVGDSLLGTQPLTCFSATAQLLGTNCVKDVINYGAELVAAYGPFSFQGEYIGMHYDRNPAIIFWENTASGGNHAPGGSSINFNGFYAYATWYLTGESRAEQYRSYEEFNAPGNGNVAQIKILNPVSAGGWGAWELAARVSEINLNDGGFTFLQTPGTRSNIQGGRQSDFTLGLNWYPDKGIRFMANWVDVFQYSANYNRPDLNGIHPQLFEIRAQVDW